MESSRQSVDRHAERRMKERKQRIDCCSVQQRSFRLDDPSSHLTNKTIFAPRPAQVVDVASSKAKVSCVVHVVKRKKWSQIIIIALTLVPTPKSYKSFNRQNKFQLVVFRGCAGRK